MRIIGYCILAIGLIIYFIIIPLADGVIVSRTINDTSKQIVGHQIITKEDLKIIVWNVFQKRIGIIDRDTYSQTEAENAILEIARFRNRSLDKHFIGLFFVSAVLLDLAGRSRTHSGIKKRTSHANHRFPPK